VKKWHSESHRAENLKSAMLGNGLITKTGLSKEGDWEKVTGSVWKETPEPKKQSGKTSYW